MLLQVLVSAMVSFHVSSQNEGSFEKAADSMQLLHKAYSVYRAKKEASRILALLQ